MKKIVASIVIVLLCVSTFSIIVPNVVATPELFSLLWSRSVSQVEGMAVDDINKDGKNEIVYADWSGWVYAVDSSNNNLWTFKTGWYNILRTGDLNHDGNIEVVVGSADRNVYCINGATGSQIWRYPTTGLAMHGNLTLVDVTGDSKLEVVVGEWDSNVYYASPAKVYVIDSAGNKVWDYTFPDDTIPFAEDVDGNGKAEVVVYWGRPQLRSEGYVTMFNSDGSIRWSTTVSGCAWGGIFFVDINGDGIKETVATRTSNNDILIFNSLTGTMSAISNNYGLVTGILGNRFLTCKANTLYALDLSGNKIWEVPIGGNPPPGMPYLPTADLNGDGKDEILAGSDTSVNVLGSDGSVIWSTSSSRVWEARIGDIDSDSLLDLIIGTETKLTVYRNELGAQPPAEHDFSMRWTSPFYGVTAGDDTFFVIHLEYSEGFDEIVTLSVQNLPDGCSAWFDIDTLRPPVSYRTLHVATPNTLNNGTYVFLVKGETSDSYQIIPVTLTIGTGKITGTVYRDDNGNGLRDSGEPVVSGATLGYYATQNYLNLYVAGTTSNPEGEFTLVNVPFNVNNEITATANGLTQRCIFINIMNHLETHIDIGIKPPTVNYKPVEIDGHKYQLKLLHDSHGEVIKGYVLNLTDMSFVDPSDDSNDNYASGIVNKTVRAAMIQDLAEYITNIGDLPYDRIFGQNPELENWMTQASGSIAWYAMMPLTGFSISLDNTEIWNNRLKYTVFEGTDSQVEHWFGLHEWSAPPGLDSAIATLSQLSELPGLRSSWKWSELVYKFGTKAYNVLVASCLLEEQVKYLNQIEILVRCWDPSTEVADAIHAVSEMRNDLSSWLYNNANDFVYEIAWEVVTKKVPFKFIEDALWKASLTVPNPPIAWTPLMIKVLLLKLATTVLLSPQETYDNLRDADAGRTILKSLSNVEKAILQTYDVASFLTEDQIEALNLLTQMQFRVAMRMSHAAQSIHRCSLVGQAADSVLPWWRQFTEFFANYETWAQGYLDFIGVAKLKKEASGIIEKIEVPDELFRVSLGSPATLEVIDSSGRRIGLDPATGELVNEMPEGLYVDIEGIDHRYVLIAYPQPGTYHVNLQGIATGYYTLTVEYFTSEQTMTQTFAGTISEQERRCYSVLISETGEMTSISWEHVFEDVKRGTMLKISSDDKYFQFISPDRDFGPNRDAKMIQLKHAIIIYYEDKEMRLIATVVDDKIDFCSAIAYDKQTRKTYLLIDKPNC